MKSILRYWPWKLASLAVASLLWLATVGEPEITTSLSVPVYYQNAPKDLEISSTLLDRVRLEVNGPSSKLRQHEMADAAVVIDLSGIDRPGEETFTIDGASAKMPAGVRVMSAAPPQVRLRFERRMTREVPVVVRVAAQPAQGMAVVSLKPEPERVTVTGPESRVSAVSAAETDALDLSGLTGPGELSTHVTIDDPQVRFRDGSRVAVKVELRKK
jgi:YbbR domain-containing protein